MSLNNPANPLKVSGGAAVSFDDTMTTNDEGVTGVTNPMRGILTQAEYDALPEAEKAKGTYVIKDGDGSGNAASGGGSSNEVYSTEETVIGTFLGKPLYRKVWKGPVPNYTANVMSSLLTVDVSVDDITNMSLFFRGSDNADMWNKAVTLWPNNNKTPLSNNGVGAFYEFKPVSKMVNFTFSTTGYAGSNDGKHYVFILEYTKTTDTATS